MNLPAFRCADSVAGKGGITSSIIKEAGNSSSTARILKEKFEKNDADYLAACLLMPRKSFKKQYEDLSRLKGCVDIITELQRKFCTSRESIERRILEVYVAKRRSNATRVSEYNRRGV